MRAVWLILVVWSGAAWADVPYRPTDDGRFELTRAIEFQTKAFGRVRLTKGYRSDGSTSPIGDSEATRLAGFLHDALYAASGHLRFPDGAPRRYSKAQVDLVYCKQMRALGAGPRHARANCWGARALPFTARSWARLAPKRRKRWRQWLKRGWVRDG